MSPGDHVYRAMYDYTPSSDGEMPLSEGQVSRIKSIQWRLRGELGTLAAALW